MKKMRTRKEIEAKIKEYENIQRLNNPFLEYQYKGMIAMAKWVLGIE